MRTYIGVRVFGHGKILVISQGARTYLPHSAEGPAVEFDWGYGGIGPAVTALALLTDVLDQDRQKDGERPALTVPHDLRQRFIDEVVSQLPRGRYLRGIHEEWRLSDAEISDWMTRGAVIPQDTTTYARPLTTSDLPEPLAPDVRSAPESVGERPAAQTESDLGAAGSSPASAQRSSAPPVPKTAARRRRAVSWGGWATASLISGALALVLLPNLLGPLAVILGAAALGRKERYGLWGVALGTVAMAYVLFRAFRTAGKPGPSMVVGLPAILLLILALAAGAYLMMAHRERRRSALGRVGAEPTADHDRHEF